MLPFDLCGQGPATQRLRRLERVSARPNSKDSLAFKWKAVIVPKCPFL